MTTPNPDSPRPEISPLDLIAFGERYARLGPMISEQVRSVVRDGADAMYVKRNEIALALDLLHDPHEASGLTGEDSDGPLALLLADLEMWLEYNRAGGVL